LFGYRSEEANIEFEKLKQQNRNLHERINSLCKKLNQTDNELSLQKQNQKMVSIKFKIKQYIIPSVVIKTNSVCGF
jgi:uncharacterized protein involved in exopolysaccharide biosynthesis